jgi:hypothetical protein
LRATSRATIGKIRSDRLRPLTGPPVQKASLAGGLLLMHRARGTPPACWPCTWSAILRAPSSWEQLECTGLQ